MSLRRNVGFFSGSTTSPSADTLGAEIGEGRSEMDGVLGTSASPVARRFIVRRMSLTRRT